MGNNTHWNRTTVRITKETLDKLKTLRHREYLREIEQEFKQEFYMFPQQTQPNLYDQIALAVAKEIGFECYCRSYGKYRYALPDTSRDPRLRKCKSGVPMPNDTSRNPCREIKLGVFEVYITIEGTSFQINNPKFSYDINDPTFVEQIKELFSDLNQVVDRESETSRQ